MRFNNQYDVELEEAEGFATKQNDRMKYNPELMI